MVGRAIGKEQKEQKEKSGEQKEKGALPSNKQKREKGRRRKGGKRGRKTIEGSYRYGHDGMGEMGGVCLAHLDANRSACSGPGDLAARDLDCHARQSAMR